MSDAESWEYICCRCGSEVKETIHPGKRACHVTCGSCMYPDNPKCASCEIVGHCRLALDYLKSLRPDGVKKGRYFKEQLSGEETIYHTLLFVNAQQQIVGSEGEKKYLETLKDTNSKRVQAMAQVKGLSRKIGISPEKAKEIRERVKERKLILREIEYRGPSTIGELSEAVGMEKSKLLRHLTAMRQFGPLSIIGERASQPLYGFAE
jgi:DNA-binding transcriptional ArsR family regulator